MRTADLVTASFLMVLGGVVAFDAVGLGIGWGTDGPKSGFFPFSLGVLMIAACAVIVMQAARRADARPFVTRAQLGPVLKVLWPAVALVALTQWLGLYVAAAFSPASSCAGARRTSGPACAAPPSPLPPRPSSA